MYNIIDKTLLCIVDYYSKFNDVMKANGLSADSQIRVVKVVFAEFGLPKTVSDTGTNFIYDKFRQFCMQLNIKQVITLSYHYQCTRKVEAFIKITECTIKVP